MVSEVRALTNGCALTQSSSEMVSSRHEMPMRVGSDHVILGHRADVGQSAEQVGVGVDWLCHIAYRASLLSVHCSLARSWASRAAALTLVAWPASWWSGE